MITEQKKQVLELFRTARNLYKEMKFAEAYKAFTKVLEVDPSDKPSQVYRARCKDYAQNPPPADWDGVYVYRTK